MYLSSFLPDPDTKSKQQKVEKGMDKGGGKNTSAYALVEGSDILKLLKPRADFSHKGTYGHALIVAGAAETMGAALLSAKGCLYGGAGLTTLSIPESGLTALNTSLPEVMYLDRDALGLIKKDATDKYNAIAIGPGIGKDKQAEKILEQLLKAKRALILDADALNILSSRTDLLSNILPHSILTPHLKEFDHLFGEHKNWESRLETAVTKAREMQIVIVLKNQYTFIIDEQGSVFINPTGNPAMAQGGMGDVLTGLITAYIAQGHTSKDAAVLACYFHGKAGDELAARYFNVTASKIAMQIPKTVRRILNR
ncbi:NAD(P)H-hydrate dehydratase [Pedobacter metabolipauper]|uniref:ADP-dependent (S)-NAD(P)H-hydrate dehydratase n=1 Tax=Pedobacter metabolipauper TaxID=425513 RepID=A0A4R6SUC2_9SPHI|nr:NAD(P)H-hydrate dehydratase [Pedobacter metabolipauper]TDQ07666.1 NAD(P)H-hydrate epimerase [Pedobacter metabolipauper]